MTTYPIINRHAAWMVVNPIQGCPNGCKYCFLQSVNGTHTEPMQLLSHAKVVEEIIKSKYYVRDIPLCFFSQTDIFATKKNIEYLLLLLDELLMSRLSNPIVFITKREIPGIIIRKFEQLSSSGKHVIVYLSYSGLSPEIERGISETDLKNNFINLSNANINIVHYFRPIIPQNSTYESIDRILNFVSKYACATVTAGLKVEKKFQENLDFWPKVLEDEHASDYECIWPEGAKDNLIAVAKKYNHPLFETNSCALATILKEPERYGFFSSNICEGNYCPQEQRNICLTIGENHVNISCKLHGLLRKLKGSDSIKYTFKIIDDVLIISGISLTNEETCFLSGELHMRIESTNKAQGFYWNTSINNAKGKIYDNK